MIFKCTFVILLLFSRTANHLGFFGLAPERIISSVIVFGLAAVLVLHTTKVIKLSMFVLILFVLIYFFYQSFMLHSVGENVSTLSWFSFGFLGFALIPLWWMPVRQKNGHLQ